MTIGAGRARGKNRHMMTLARKQAFQQHHRTDIPRVYQLIWFIVQ